MGHQQETRTNAANYDGWPFWKPTPAIGYVGPLGGIEIAFYYELRRGNLCKT